MGIRRVVAAWGVATAALAAALPAGAQLPPVGPVRQDPVLVRAFSQYLKTAAVYVESVPDLYPGGYARISLYARRATLGHLVADEVWFRLVGASLDPQALERGRLRLLEARETALHGRTSIASLQGLFAASGVADVRVWSDGRFLYAEGTVPVEGVPVRVFLQGRFAVNGTKDLFFYLERARVNGFPVFSFLLRTLENRINPVMSQMDWPVTFRLRGLRMTRDELILSSQADLDRSCGFCVTPREGPP
ncbi:MAG: hypothetical protein QN155_08730 [Armatimonadota bacterium]|nr:hypothetical protein [Armatimonadota bacterium]MDR7403816.1 hypothetical protein [Armatimonadota bacterium]